MSESLCRTSAYGLKVKQDGMHMRAALIVGLSLTESS